MDLTPEAYVAPILDPVMDGKYFAFKEQLQLIGEEIGQENCMKLCRTFKALAANGHLTLKFIGQYYMTESSFKQKISEVLGHTNELVS